MSELSWRAIKRRVHERAGGCCEYCQTCEYNTGQPMHVEHIDPQGGDDLDNLCLACSSCNLSKGIATAASDTVSKVLVLLFNPRQQSWQEHFEWIDEGLRIHGKTPTGCATAARLKMNIQRIVRARGNWIEAGTHPP